MTGKSKLELAIEGCGKLGGKDRNVGNIPTIVIVLIPAMTMWPDGWVTVLFVTICFAAIFVPIHLHCAYQRAKQHYENASQSPENASQATITGK